MTCPKCNKLYIKKEVVDLQNNNEQLAIKKCNHVEFPNVIGSRQIVIYNSALATQNQYLTNTINKLILHYPFASIKSQLAKMYMHPNFEQLCQKWTHNTVSKGILSDIYNGQIWKEFADKELIGGRFFVQELANTHLGFILNLD